MTIDSREIYDIISRHLPDGEAGNRVREWLVPGSCLRPKVYALFAEGEYAEDSTAYSLASAIEALHVYTLIHDDIVDGDITRRGRPTLNALYGEASALFYGNLMRATAFDIVLKSKVSERVRMQSLEILNDADRITNEGQDAQERAEKGVRKFTEELWRAMTLQKSGTLFCAALSLANRSLPPDALRGIGENIGLLLQCKDDAWDFNFDGVQSRGLSDARKASPNWLLIKAEETVPHFSQIFRDARKTGNYAELLAILNQNGIRRAAEAQAGEYRNESVRYARAAGFEGEALAGFEDLLNRVLATQVKY